VLAVLVPPAIIVQATGAHPVHPLPPLTFPPPSLHSPPISTPFSRCAGGKAHRAGGTWWGQREFQMMHSFFTTEFHFFTTFDSPQFFSRWRQQNQGNCLRKLHCRFLQYTSLIKGFKLQSQYLQSYECLLQFLGQILKKTVTTL
jgi:hypothetical protein